MHCDYVLEDHCLQKDCSNVPYSVCQVSNGSPICTCPSNCPTFKEQVCGSNRKAYDNECKLRQFSCQQKTLITVASQGECRKFNDLDLYVALKLMAPSVTSFVCVDDHLHDFCLPKAIDNQQNKYINAVLQPGIIVSLTVS